MQHLSPFWYRLPPYLPLGQVRCHLQDLVTAMRILHVKKDCIHTMNSEGRRCSNPLPIDESFCFEQATVLEPELTPV